MLNDLLGYYKRNIYKLKENELRKSINELKQILTLLENKLKQLEKARGVA